MVDEMIKLYSQEGAAISDCGQYRYWLERAWERKDLLDQDKYIGTVAFVGLNPSTADASIDDPTIRRCVRFAQGWGYAALVMVNLFAFRATNPAELKTTPDPVGVANDDYLAHIFSHAHINDALVCWGSHGGFRDRNLRVMELLREHRVRIWHLGLTRSGQPRHPLYLPADSTRILIQESQRC